ncbi:MAG: YqgE/AlgH family protein [Gammaproteobacteria bacterium]
MDTGAAGLSPDQQGPVMVATHAAADTGRTGTAGEGPNLPETIKSHPQLGKGIFLIANKGMDDPNFRQTVVLITEYNDTQTVGLVINRPLQMPADKVFPSIHRLSQNSGYLHIGGPVALNSLQLLIQTGTELDPSTHLFDDVYLVNDPKTLQALTHSDITTTAVRLYAGYAGWLSGQLESELIRGDWYIWHADMYTIFAKKPEAVWPELFRRVSAQWAQHKFDPTALPTLAGSDL